MAEIELRSKESIRIPVNKIKDFICAAFCCAELSKSHAKLYSDVLISADLRGIRSHGIARLPKLLNLVEAGVVNKKPRMTFYQGSHTTGVWDADNGPGIVASDRAMNKAIAMAEIYGTGFVAVKNSNHFGYPGYYVFKAMRRGFIGICMSNGERIVTPTFSMEPFMGSNPMSIGIPGETVSDSFYLDMATAAAARGKIETYLREGRQIPSGWVPASFGPLKLDNEGVLTFDVPLLPIGGEKPETGGHKGYALSLMVELLCSLLVGQISPATGHFMGAIKIESFQKPSVIHSQMDKIFNTIRNLKKAPGHERIYIPGELEAIAEKENRRLGIPITLPVLKQLDRIKKRMGLEFYF